MHPAIKIVSLILVTIFITQGGWFTLALTSTILLPFYVIDSRLWFSAIKMLSRLKWFFLSIIVIYYYYTPEIQSSQSYLTTLNERFTPGLFRISVLIIILFSVNLFIKTTTKEDILSALLWLFLPLKFFHINIDRISLRAVLTIEYIEELSARLAQYKEKYPININTGAEHSFLDILKQKKQSLLQLVKHSGIILHEILIEAENTSGKLYTINCLNAPEAKQFIIPLVLCLLLYISL